MASSVSSNAAPTCGSYQTSNLPTLVGEELRAIVDTCGSLIPPCNGYVL